MVKCRLLVIGATILLLTSCGKQGNEKVGKTYFKMAMLELSDESLEPNYVYKKALFYVNKALEQQHRPEYYALQGSLLFKLGDFAASEISFEQAYDCGPDPLLKAEIMNNHACLLAEKGETQKALAIWEQLQQNTAYQTPEVAWFNVGKVYAQQGFLPKAQAAFAKAAELSPSYLDAHFYAGMIASQRGDVELAKKSLQAVLAMEPAHQGALTLSHRLGLDQQRNDAESGDC